MKRLLAFFLSLIFFGSCDSETKPKGMIGREKMVEVLTDVHLVNGYTSTVMNLDTIKQVTANYLNVVYKKHQVDSIQFKKSLRYYSEHPKMLSEIYDQVIKKLETKEKEMASPKKADDIPQ